MGDDLGDGLVICLVISYGIVISNVFKQKPYDSSFYNDRYTPSLPIHT